MLTRNVTMQIMRLLIFKRVTSQLLNKFKERLRGSRVESGNNLLQFCTYYSKVNACLNLKLGSLYFLS
jgi:hypothetical protein